VTKIMITLNLRVKKKKRFPLWLQAMREEKTKSESKVKIPETEVIRQTIEAINLIEASKLVQEYTIEALRLKGVCYII